MMPELVQLCKDYGGKGVVFIGIHCQDVPKDQVVGLCEDAGLNFPTYGSGSVRGHDFQGIPHTVIFDHKGVMVFGDHPSKGFADKLKECADAMPDFMLGPQPYDKLKGVAAEVAKRKNLGKNLKTVREKMNSADPVEKEEATRMFALLSKHAQGQLDAAKALKADSPAKCLDALEEVAKTFKGDEIGAEAEKAAKEYKADPAFQKELDGEKDLTKLEEAVKKEYKPCAEHEKFQGTCASCLAKNDKAAQKCKGKFEDFRKKFAGTKAAESSKKLQEKYGIKTAD